MKLLGKILLVVAFSPLLIVAGAVALVFAGPVLVYEMGVDRAFRRRHEGALILVGSRRRGWYDFTGNNLVPVLPEGTRAVWWKAERGGRDSRLVAALRRAGIVGTAKPYLVLVTRRRLLARSLHKDLQEWKKRAAKSEETQRACADVIERALVDLRARA